MGGSQEQMRRQDETSLTEKGAHPNGVIGIREASDRTIKPLVYNSVSGSERADGCETVTLSLGLCHCFLWLSHSLK